MELSEYTVETPRFTFAGLKASAKVVAVEVGGLIDVVFDTPGFGVRKHRAHSEDTRKTTQQSCGAGRSTWQLRGLLLDKVVVMHVTGETLNGDLIVRLFDSATGRELKQREPSPDGPFSASSFADELRVDAPAAVNALPSYGC